MGLAHSPKIVTDGLVLCLDAANKKSYPGSGTVWTDLSVNNNNGTLTNGPTYSNNSFTLDGIDDTILFTKQLPGSGTKTISCFFNISRTNRSSLVETRNGGVLGWAITVNRTSIGNLSYYATGASTIEYAAGITTNVWYQACLTISSSSVATLYLNGALVGAPVSAFSDGVTNTSYNGSVGNLDSTTLSSYLQGSVSNVMAYNRALSAIEIQQNFNALRGRYGI